jgi:hypothetical protein
MQSYLKLLFSKSNRTICIDFQNSHVHLAIYLPHFLAFINVQRGYPFLRAG